MFFVSPVSLACDYRQRHKDNLAEACRQRATATGVMCILIVRLTQRQVLRGTAMHKSNGNMKIFMRCFCIYALPFSGSTPGMQNPPIYVSPSLASIPQIKPSPVSTVLQTTHFTLLWTPGFWTICSCIAPRHIRSTHLNVEVYFMPHKSTK